MGCVKLHILDEQYKRTELRISYFNRELTANNSAENPRRCTLIRYIDPDGRDPRVKVGLNSKLEQVSQLATIAHDNGSQALSASISAEASIYKTGVKFEAGSISAEANLKAGSGTVKASTDDISITATTVSATIKASSGNESVQANATLGTAQVSIDENANVKVEASVGGASVRVNEGERFVSANNSAKVSVGTQLGAVKAELSVNLNKAANFFVATVAAIGAMITPEAQKPEEIK
jgi:hypothetical protein